MNAALFVTGTDTGVGKTVAACALVRGLRDQGLDVGVMKPIETGVDPTAGPLDAIALSAAAGEPDALDLVCPLRFSLPAAPCVAADDEGKKVDLKPVREAFGELVSRHDWLVVEGAGGLLVPTTPDATMADLARDLGLPVLLVARPALGTINHTRLCVEETLRRGLDLVGVIVSHDHAVSDADAKNLDYLRSWLGDRLLAEIPTVEGATPARLEPSVLHELVARVARYAGA